MTEDRGSLSGRGGEHAVQPERLMGWRGESREREARECKSAMRGEEELMDEERGGEEWGGVGRREGRRGGRDWGRVERRRECFGSTFRPKPGWLECLQNLQDNIMLNNTKHSPRSQSTTASSARPASRGSPQGLSSPRRPEG